MNYRAALTDDVYLAYRRMENAVIELMNAWKMNEDMTPLLNALDTAHHNLRRAYQDDPYSMETRKAVDSLLKIADDLDE